ncbi:MAG: sodium-dependent transporter [Coriobacteriales bacterium]|jgi:NSS family neurotransmitter:Na+ symporter|nr:sodium-dependent transporter [Coriobacteriales bacterium]
MSHHQNELAASASTASAAPTTKKPKRSQFSGKVGFILAASASAIGLGNLWRFPALDARYGGGAFLVVYIILVFTFGFTLMTAEVAIGRKTGLSAIGAFAALGKKYRIIGILEAIVPIIITPYYCVIGGWICKYIVAFCTPGFADLAQPSYFSAFTAQTGEPIFWTLLFVLLTMVVVALGVENGIERLNKVFMPLLLILGIAIGIYSLTIPGALQGLGYFLIPHLSDFSISTLVAAMGQMFFSLSLAMGIMVTYGSYMKKSDNLSSSVAWIELFDTIIAVLAGFMIIPAVYAFSGAAGAQQAGASLMFVTLPRVFDLTVFPQAIGIAFFVLVLFAALTSAISLAETVVSICQDGLHMRRRTAVAVTAIGVAVIALLPTLGSSALSWFKVPIGGGQDILSFMDFISNSVLMPLVALLLCLAVGWGLKPYFVKEEVEVTPGAKMGRFGLFKVMIRFVAPIFMVVILVASVLSAVGVINIFS